MTVYTLNKQYGFSRTQSVRSTVPVDSVALTCADVPKLIQLYRYFTVPTLSDVVARHRLQTSTRILSLASIIAEHQCDTACPGYNDVFVFHKLKQPRTVKYNLELSSRFFDVLFDNSPHNDPPGVVSTYSLNRHFEFVTIGDGPTMELMYSNSTGHSICRTSKLVDFVSHFVHLHVVQLTSIARAHTMHAVDFDADKPALIQSFLHHVCSDTCDTDHLVFIRRLYSREGQFSPLPVTVEMQDGVHPHLFMTDLEVLPILMDNHMQVDEHDGRDHVSTYLLNTSFSFVEIVSLMTLHTHKAVDFGIKYNAAHADNISLFFSMYDYLTKKQLTSLCRTHRIFPPDFCYDCLYKWLGDKKKTLPLCRTRIKEQPIHNYALKEELENTIINGRVTKVDGVRVTLLYYFDRRFSLCDL